jgi:hypothetical protein
MHGGAVKTFRAPSRVPSRIFALEAVMNSTTSGICLLLSILFCLPLAYLGPNQRLP